MYVCTRARGSTGFTSKPFDDSKKDFPHKDPSTSTYPDPVDAVCQPPSSDRNRATVSTPLLAISGRKHPEMENVLPVERERQRGREKGCIVINREEMKVKGLR